MASTELVKEAERLMGICNACRYCEGHCAVFPAMEMRFTFPAEDLRYLANLCHGCGSCFHHCQYAPPRDVHVELVRGRILAMVKAGAAPVAEIGQVAKILRGESEPHLHRWEHRAVAFAIAAGIADPHQPFGF